MSCCGRNTRGVVSVLGGALIFFVLGHHGTFGNMSPYITSYIRNKKIQEDMTYATSAWIYSFALLGSGCSMFLGGVLERKIGARLTVLLGGWLLSLGVFLTYFTVQESFYLVVLTNGFMMGLGYGITYMPPVSCANKWFPRKKGFVIGIVMAGFGVGVFVLNQIETNFINPHGAVPTQIAGDDRFFNDAEVLDRVPACFLVIGTVYASLVLIGSLMLSTPPEKEENKGLLELEEDKRRTSSAIVASWTPRETLRSAKFYQLWVIVFFYAQSVTFINTLYKAYGQTFIKDDQFLAFTGGIGYIMFSVGVIFWGIIGDKYTLKVAMVSFCILLAAFLFSFISTPVGSEAMFAVWISGVYFAYSGMSSVLPAATVHQFGPKYTSAIYGLLMTAQSLASLSASLIATTLQALLGWFGMFCTVAGSALIACIFGFLFIDPNA